MLSRLSQQRWPATSSQCGSVEILRAIRELAEKEAEGFGTHPQHMYEKAQVAASVSGGDQSNMQQHI